MGLIYKNLKISGDIAELEVRVLFDTGASHSFIKREIAEMVAHIGKTPRSLRFGTASGAIETDEVVFAEVLLSEHRLHHMFMVAKELPEQLILGADFFQRWKITLNPETEEVSIDPSALRMILI